MPRRAVPCADVLTKYKHEVHGPLDFRGTGVDERVCFGGHRRGHDRDDDDGDNRQDGER